MNATFDFESGICSDGVSVNGDNYYKIQKWMNRLFLTVIINFASPLQIAPPIDTLVVRGMSS